MTRQEALAEARKRWGNSGCINVISGNQAKGHPTIYEVCGGWGMEHYGSGPSWEAAFANAGISLSETR